MKKFFSVVILSFVLVACSSYKTGLEMFEADSGKRTAENIAHAEKLKLSEPKAVEFHDKIRDTYEIGEKISVILHDDGKLWQVMYEKYNFNKVIKLLDSIQFPVREGIKQALKESETVTDPLYAHYSEYKGVGVNILKFRFENEFRIIITSDKERMKELKEAAAATSDDN